MRNIPFRPITGRRLAARGERAGQSGRVAAKNALAVERRGQYAEGAGDDRAFDGADNQGAEGSERENVRGEGNRYKYRAENEAEELTSFQIDGAW